MIKYEGYLTQICYFQTILSCDVLNHGLKWNRIAKFLNSGNLTTFCINLKLIFLNNKM